MSCLETRGPGALPGVVGREFSANETTVYIRQGPLDRDTRKTRLYIDGLTKYCDESLTGLTLYFSWEQWFNVS